MQKATFVGKKLNWKGLEEIGGKSCDLKMFGARRLVPPTKSPLVLDDGPDQFNWGQLGKSFLSCFLSFITELDLK